MKYTEEEFIKLQKENEHLKVVIKKYQEILDRLAELNTQQIKNISNLDKAIKNW